MKIVAIIQARMGSSRLPGKLTLPIEGEEIITRVFKRIVASNIIDEVVVATSSKDRDSLLPNRAREVDQSVYCGDEQDVLARLLNAAVSADADIIVRILGNHPAVSPQIIDYAVEKAFDSDADYVSNILTRTFPLGLDVEVFTRNSFVGVEGASTESYEREHVTAYYLDHSELFSTYNITSDELFDEKKFQNRTDIDLALDDAADYAYLDSLFTGLDKQEPDFKSIIEYVDNNDLKERMPNVS
jgi:spore coat polysaccharide biosynthesis protein SpsF